jgi:putative oxidoreductase
MTMQTHISGRRRQRLVRFFERVNRLLQTIAARWLAQLLLRLALAVPFWRSGTQKWDGFLQLNDVAVLLFSSEFKLHLPGGPYPFPAPGAVAFISGSAEIALPILLVLGLASRLAAFGFLVMTLVIQLTVPDGWPVHISWAAIALAIMAWGPGRISLDYLVASRYHGLRLGAGRR